MTDRLLTAPEVAERLQLTTDFVYALTRRGQIPHLKFGRTYRYRAASIDRWLEEQEQVKRDKPAANAAMTKGSACAR